jgi:hypothetical protein
MLFDARAIITVGRVSLVVSLSRAPKSATHSNGQRLVQKPWAYSGSSPSLLGDILWPALYPVVPVH